jgi:hypothetical protein
MSAHDRRVSVIKIEDPHVSHEYLSAKDAKASSEARDFHQ